MNKIKCFYLPICLALTGMGMLLLGIWDLQHAQAATRPEGWNTRGEMPIAHAFYGSVQCPDDPNGFYVVAGWKGWFDNGNEVSYYNAGTNTWTTLASYPEEMGILSVTCYQGNLYSAGGNLEGNDTSDHFYRYDIATDTWLQLNNLPRKQNYAALAAWDGYLYLIGGTISPVVPPIIQTQVDRYNIQTNSWEVN